MKRFVVLIIFALLLAPTQAQTTSKPLILPFQDAAGLNTWLLGQAYGNTTGAFNFGDQWYSAGQGLHFGLDFSAPCGTPLVAVADGVVAFVDNLNFGSAPHNLILRHDAIGLTTLYGHLQDTSPLRVGDVVNQGQFVGYSGDPDDTCQSRPHLHLEIRSLDYRTAYNPIDYMDANWESLSLVGRFGNRFFQMDLDNARRWITLDDQPSVSFGGRRLNAYTAAYPLPNDQTPPSNARLSTDVAPITAETTATLGLFEGTGCCWEFWWHPTDPNRAYAIDGYAGQRATVLEFDANGQLVAGLGDAPPAFYSPDYTHRITKLADGSLIQNIASGESWQVPTGDFMPALNVDNTRLLWIEFGGASVPGQEEPNNTIFISDARGSNPQALFTEAGIEARWLDSTRILLDLPQRPYTQLDVYDTVTSERYTLGRWYRPRGFSISPDGARMMFYLPQQPNPVDTGLYWMNIAPNATTQRVDWFGAYQWRDADSVFFIPFDPNTNTHHLRSYDVTTGATYRLTDPTTQPFTVMDGRWSVNADGSQIVFRNARDRSLWTLRVD